MPSSWWRTSSATSKPGLSPRDAAYKSMDEVGGALIAIALVLCAVFVPSAFITGISGQFYRQFALTIAGATIISLIVSLTLSPAMCALLLKPRRRAPARDVVGAADPRASSAASTGASSGSRAGYDWLIGARRALRRHHARCSMSAFSPIGLNEFRKTPIGFIPQVDRGYLIVVLQLAAGIVAVAHRRGPATRRRRRPQDARGRACREHRRILRRDLHAGAEFRRGLSDARALGQACDVIPRQSAAGITAELFKRLAGFQEALILVDPAAAGRGHRQCRRRSDDGRGSRRPRLAGAAGSDHRDGHQGARRRRV